MGSVAFTSRSIGHYRRAFLFGAFMSKHYKGERISELLEIIAEMETRLKLLTNHTDPFSLAQYEVVANGYATLAIAKAKLTALQGA